MFLPFGFPLDALSLFCFLFFLIFPGGGGVGPKNRRRNMSQPHKRLTVGSVEYKNKSITLPPPPLTLSTCRCFVDAFFQPPLSQSLDPITLLDAIDPLIQQESKQKTLGGYGRKRDATINQEKTERFDVSAVSNE
jgi:hypothetical protein